MEHTEQPESSPEFAALACLLIAVVGDPAQIKLALEGAADIARAISTMDMTVIRLRSQQHDAKVQRDFALAEAWLRGFGARSEQLQGL